MSKKRRGNYYLPYLIGLLFIVTILWEGLGTIGSEGELVEQIEQRLHEQEQRADALLNSLDSLEDYGNIELPDGVELLVLRGDNVISWSDGALYFEGIDSVLKSGAPYVRLHNGYYDVRHRSLWDTDCYALILLRSNYNVGDSFQSGDFPDFMKISDENGEQLIIERAYCADDNLLHNIDGEPVCRIYAPGGFRDRSVNHWLFGCYALLYLALFVLYDEILKRSQRVVKQLVVFVSFVVLLFSIIAITVYFKFPPSIFRLSLFDRGDSGFISIGELLLYVYGVFQIMAITIYRLKSNRKMLVPFRFYITVAWVIFVYLYASLFSYIIHELIFKNDLCMNVAVVLDIGIPSLIAYMVIAMAAVALVVASDRVISVYRDFVSFRGALLSTFLASLVILMVSFASWSMLSPIEWVVYMVILCTIVIGRYKVKIDQQRTIYLIILIVLSGYLLFNIRDCESKKEILHRVELVERITDGDFAVNTRIMNDGYSDLLINISNEGRDYYMYSYAIYDKTGVLLSNRGDYLFHRDMEDWIPVSAKEQYFIYDEYSHLRYQLDSGETLFVSLPIDYFGSSYYFNFLYIFLLVIIFSSYNLIYHLNIYEPFEGRDIKVRIKYAINFLIFALFLILTITTLYLNYNSLKGEEHDDALMLAQSILQRLEENGNPDSKVQLQFNVDNLSAISKTDINIFEAHSGKLFYSSRPEVFQSCFVGLLVNPGARSAILEENENRVILEERIGQRRCMSVYAPLNIGGEEYILNVPYFVQGYNYGHELAQIGIVAINITIILIMLSFSFSAWIANWMIQPLTLVTENLKRMQLNGKNEKIRYNRNDEVAILVKQYNDAIDNLEESVKLLAQSEREGAWREMARQIAHEIKNPLTPMRLNIQFLLRSMELEDDEAFKLRFKELSSVILEQIDSMAATATAFSDFAKLPKQNPQRFDLVQLLRSEVMLFRDSGVNFIEVYPDSYMIYTDKILVGRVLVNLIKNATQSISPDVDGEVTISLAPLTDDVVQISVSDNGEGIDESIRKKIFEPNFSTKSDGMGLGLAISKRIVEALGGTITFCSNPMGGTEFIVTLSNVND